MRTRVMSDGLPSLVGERITVTDLHALVFNAISDAIRERGEWVRLSARRAATDAVLASLGYTTTAPNPEPAEPDPGRGEERPGRPIVHACTPTELAHAIDNATPYPIEIPAQVCHFMAERLLEMLHVAKRPENAVWQPEEPPAAGPEPIDPNPVVRACTPPRMAVQIRFGVTSSQILAIDPSHPKRDRIDTIGRLPNGRPFLVTGKPKPDQMPPGVTPIAHVHVPRAATVIQECNIRPADTGEQP